MRNDKVLLAVETMLDNLSFLDKHTLDTISFAVYAELLDRAINSGDVVPEYEFEEEEGEV